MMKYTLSNNRGEIGSALLFWVVILIIAAYIGVMFGSPVFKNYLLKGEIKSQVELAHINRDEVIKHDIVTRASSLNIKYKPEKLIVNRGYDTMKISIEYEVPVVFFNKEYKRYYFKIEEQAEMKDQEFID